MDLPARIEHANIPSQLICHARLPKDFRPPKPPKADAGTKSDSRFSLDLSDGSTTDDQFTVEVEPRSTEGVIYYLGEIGRCELGLDPLSACATPTIIATSRSPGAPEDVLFNLSRGKESRPALNEADDLSIAVNWAGYRYAVQIDPQARDRSGQVLRILTQLLALNRSAKDFPTPAAVPIISR